MTQLGSYRRGNIKRENYSISLGGRPVEHFLNNCCRRTLPPGHCGQRHPFTYGSKLYFTKRHAEKTMGSKAESKGPHGLCSSPAYQFLRGLPSMDREWECNLSKPLPPSVALGRGLCHSNREMQSDTRLLLTLISRINTARVTTRGSRSFLLSG